MRTAIVYLLVFFSGFANLAAEIIGPRMFASLFGTTTTVWAIMISVTLVGLSVGYAFGGRVAKNRTREVLSILLLVNAGWLVLVSWIVWEVPAGALSDGIRIDASVIITAAFAAFFAPSVMFGMISPIAITMLSENSDNLSETVGNIYAISTIGSVLGALAAAFYLIPWVGLSLSLQVFAAGLVLFATYFWAFERRLLVPAAIIIVFLFPQPDFVWENDGDLELLAQREGYYQTIRVYEGEDFVQMHLGPSFHSRMDLETGEPTFSYAETMLDYVGEDVDGQEILVIGGAGHSMARWLEGFGANITEVEIDPFVVELSDQYFGEIDGEVVIQDGRIYIEQVEPARFDVILVDAFDGAANVPPQLTTIEFFEAVRDALKPEGRMFYNFIGTPEGEMSRSFHAMGRTINAAFDHTGASTITGETTRNIILVASQASLADLDVAPLPDDGHLLTDDENPMEIFLAEARNSMYFRR